MSKLKLPWTVRFMHWLGQYMIGLTWVWQKVLFPILRLLFRVYKVITGWYISLWKRFTYRYGKFSRKRGGLMILATVAAFYAVPETVHFTYQATLFATTSEYERVILTGSQEIDPEEDVHAIKGCSSLPCTDDNALYFRIRPTLFHHVHSLFTEGKMFYPDRIAAIVAQGYNDCKISPSYGFRQKFFVRKLQVYPDILNLVCEPLKGIDN